MSQNKRDNIKKQLSDLKYTGRDWGREFYEEKLYSISLIDEYLGLLNIESREGRLDMKDSIVRAAMYYESIKHSHIEHYKPKGSEERKIKALIKPIENLRKQINNLYDGSLINFTPIVQSAEKIIQEDSCPEGAEKIIKSMFWTEKGGNTFQPQAILYFLDFYKQCCEEALSKGISKNCAHKGYALEMWVCNLKHSWVTYSPIPFNAGKYYEGVGYNSEAIHIMKKIMEPLDASITVQSIANKLIEENKNKR